MGSGLRDFIISLSNLVEVMGKRRPSVTRVPLMFSRVIQSKFPAK